MSFLSSETIKARLQELVVEGDPDRVSNGAYELALGPSAYITESKSKKRTDLQKNEQFVIPPGQIALLVTEERITIPADLIAFISIKAKHKLHGLVNVSGFHVDPGFSGRLKFSVYNAGPKYIIISRNTPVFLIWFASFDQTTSDIYNGAHQNQIEISDDDIIDMQQEMLSPFELSGKIQELQGKIINIPENFQDKITNIYKYFGVIVTIFITIFTLLFSYTLTLKQPATTRQASHQGNKQGESPGTFSSSGGEEKTKMLSCESTKKQDSNE